MRIPTCHVENWGLGGDLHETACFGLLNFAARTSLRAFDRPVAFPAATRRELVDTFSLPKDFWPQADRRSPPTSLLGAQVRSRMNGIARSFNRETVEKWKYWFMGS
jgi:hypothetical protein